MTVEKIAWATALSVAIPAMFFAGAGFLPLWVAFGAVGVFILSALNYIRQLVKDDQGSE